MYIVTVEDDFGDVSTTKVFDGIDPIIRWAAENDTYETNELIQACYKAVLTSTAFLGGPNSMLYISHVSTDVDSTQEYWRQQE